MADFKNADVQRQFDEKIAKIESVLNAPVVDTKYLWNEVVKNYATKMEQIRRVLKPQTFSGETDKNSEKLEIDADILKEIGDFLKTCAEHEFQIALVGTIKAGKSTLINALLNYELASTDITPETASLTKFRKADEDYLEITFYTTAEWNENLESVTHKEKSSKNGEEKADASTSVFAEEYKKLKADSEKEKWLDHEPEKIICNDREELKQKIAESTSSKFAKHYFVKEVAVGLRDCNLPRDVVLVDTPGLNDVVEYRSNITRDYINNANAVFACIKSDKFEGNGGIYQTLIRIFENSREHPEKIYVVATQLDTLQHPEEDWKKQKVEWIKTLNDKIFYGNVILADKNLIPVSAWLYTLLKDYKKILDDYDKVLDECNDDEKLAQKDARGVRFWHLRNTIGKWGVRETRIEKNFDKLQTATNIKILEKRLEKEILPERDKFLISDIKKRYEKCLNLIRDVMENQKSKQKELITDSQKSLEEIRAKRKEKEIGLKQARRDKDVLENYIAELKKATRKRIEEVKKTIKDIDKKGGA